MTAGSRREYVDSIALDLANGVCAVSFHEFHRVLAHAMPPTKGPARILHRRLALPPRQGHGPLANRGMNTSIAEASSGYCRYRLVSCPVNSEDKEADEIGRQARREADPVACATARASNAA